VDGIIIAGRVNEKLIEYIDGLGLPVILIDYDLRHGRYSSVLIDNRRGAQLAVRHLVELGHRAIGFIGGDPDHPSMAHRYGGYRDTLHECGIPFDERMVIVDEKDTRVRNGVAATERLLQSGARPTAIFAANDAMAIGCLQVAKRKGMVVPRDLAVVGFDDIEISSHIDPHLTTVRVFKEDLGKIAVQRIVDVIKTGSPSVVTTLVPVELVVRDSTVGKAVPSAVTGSATVL
jgi:LacI family transcriptional regulator